MKTVSLGDAEMRVSILGFGCSAIMGRVGRNQSWAALTAAYDAGINFFDTARSYGYGESEALLGEFLQGRRDSVIVSTKFGIVPAQSNRLNRLLKPVARTIFDVAPQARSILRNQMASQLSSGHFTVRALHESLDASLTALRTSYVDLLFLHEPPVSVLQREDLFAALDQLVAKGKIRHFGIAADPETIEAAMCARIPELTSVQFPYNLFNLDKTPKFDNPGSNWFVIANHPFGGPQRVAQVKSLLQSFSRDSAIPTSLREKLTRLDDQMLAEIVFQLILQNSGIKMVVASMLQLDHLRANIAAVEHTQIETEELRWIRDALRASLS